MKHYLFVLVAALSLANCGSQSEDLLARIKSEGKIRVGYISYFDITSYDNRSGEAKGYLVDVLTEVLSDLSIAGTFNTPVRAKAVNFSRPIFYLGNGAVVRNDDIF